jgi:hypothetical protein
MTKIPTHPLNATNALVAAAHHEPMPPPATEGGQQEIPTDPGFFKRNASSAAGLIRRHPFKSTVAAVAGLAVVATVISVPVSIKNRQYPQCQRKYVRRESRI